MYWKANPEVVVQRLGESMVVVNLATDRILELNDTAATLFELVSSGVGEDEIARSLASEFEVDAALVREEIGSVLQSLAEEQVVFAHDS